MHEFYDIIKQEFTFFYYSVSWIVVKEKVFLNVFLNSP